MVGGIGREEFTKQRHVLAASWAKIELAHLPPVAFILGNHLGFTHSHLLF